MDSIKKDFLDLFSKFFSQYLKLFNKKNVILISVLIFVFALLGELIKNKPLMNSFFKSISIFTLNPPDANVLTFFAFILTTLLVIRGFLELLFKNWVLEKQINTLMKREKNILLFGFNKINQNFLENLNKQVKVIVIDKKEIDFEEFENKGYIFLKREIDDKFLSDLNFENTSDIIIDIGEDRKNIDLALRIIERLKGVLSETKLLIHYKDSEINDLFFEKLEEDKEILVNIKLFSIYSEIVDNLFSEYDIQLVPIEYALIGSKKELNIAIIGNSQISLEIIKRIFVNFIFPNDTKIKLYLIDEKPIEFEEYIIYKTHYSVEKFPHIEIESKKLDFELLKNQNFWKNLVNIIIAYEDETKNLHLAIELFENVFVYEDLKYPNVYFNMFKELKLSEYINKNDKKFKNFFTFGNIKEIFKKENLLDDEKFEIAKQIHNGYGIKYNNKIETNKEILNKSWFKSARYSDKLSNIAQYEHISYKLLSLGLYKLENNEKSKQNLLKSNQEIFFSKLKHLGMLDENLIFKFSCEVEKSYDEKLNYQFDKKIVDEFFEKFKSSEEFYKLVNTEHKRWIAYHYLNGWEYADKKDKSRKKHNCLVEINDFDDYSRKMTIIYDIYAYLYLPNYLAAGGYEIKP